MTAARPRRVAILGGGIAGLTAAWELSRPGAASGRFEVTVYERDWRLGGKGASSRGVHGRIEEHGLHVWLGYYDNAFRLLREVYEELDRHGPTRRARSPAGATRSSAAGQVGRGRPRDGRRRTGWRASPATTLEPGSPGATAGPLALATFVERGLRLLADFAASVRAEPPPVPAGVVISASPLPPRQAAPDDFASVVRQAEIAALVGAVRVAAACSGPACPQDSALGGRLLEFLDRTRDDLLDRLRRDDDARRTWQLADLLIACLRGIVDRTGCSAARRRLSRDRRPRLPRLARPPRRRARDAGLAAGARDVRLRVRLRGAVTPRVRGSPPASASSSPTSCSSSTRARSSGRCAPGWATSCSPRSTRRCAREACASRSRTASSGLHVDGRRRTIAPISFTCDASGRRPRPAGARQGAAVLPVCAASRGRARRCGSSPARTSTWSCWPPAFGARAADRRGADRGLHRMAGDGDVRRARSRRDRSRSGRARTRTSSAGAHPGATVAGYPTPFEVYASMTHTLAAEDWPADAAPAAVGYFCGALPDADDAPATRRRAAARRRATSCAARSTRLWPGVPRRPRRLAIRARERRPVRPVRAVAARHRRSGGWPPTQSRLRQPRPRRRLDRQRPQRRVRRGRGAVRAGGCQRASRRGR